MNTRLHRRLTKLERQYPTVKRDSPEAAEERIRRVVLCTLSPDELEAMIDYARQLEADPGITPNPAQAGAREVFEQRYREFKSTGQLVVNGWPVEV